jgi:uncharacterized protein
MVEMELVAVRIELPGNTPVVLLREVAGANRLLPIFIGQPEATAIAFAIDGVVTPRPMTHDLLKNVLDELGATLDRIVVTELSEGTFYAELHVRLGDATHQISSRPSDAIALALRAGCPIFAEEDVLGEAGLVEESEEESEEVVEKFREFIDSVNPDDFGS